MPESADVVVVGGGALGLSTALHLAEAGAGEVLVLERDGIAQATSNAGAGFLAVWAAGHAHDSWGAEEAELERYGLHFYGGLAADGHEIGWRANGVMWVATTEAGWSEHIEPYAAHPEAPSAEVLERDEILALAPVLAADGVLRAVYQPAGARITARAASLAIATRARERGVRIDERRPVTRLLIDAGRVTGVETARGAVAAGVVVLAAGGWTNGLVAPHAPPLPMVPLVAARLITEPLGVPETLPPLLFPEFAHLWVREEQGGLLFGASFEARPRYEFADADPPERYDQLPLDGVVETRRVAAEAAHALPLLARAQSVTVAHGAPCYTPDLRGLVGPVPGIDRLFVTGGCNEAGITHGPGYGALVAALVTGAAPSVDPAPLDPGRFGERFARGAEVVAAMKRGGRMSWVEVTEEAVK